VIRSSTSFYFEGTYDDSKFVTYGYALEGRTDTKRVHVGMCIDADTGIPITSSREPGGKDINESGRQESTIVFS
jgi:transposase